MAIELYNGRHLTGRETKPPASRPVYREIIAAFRPNRMKGTDSSGPFCRLSSGKPARDRQMALLVSSSRCFEDSRGRIKQSVRFGRFQLRDCMKLAWECLKAKRLGGGTVVGATFCAANSPMRSTEAQPSVTIVLKRICFAVSPRVSSLLI